MSKRYRIKSFAILDGSVEYISRHNAFVAALHTRMPACVAPPTMFQAAGSTQPRLGSQWAQDSHIGNMQ